MSVASSIPLPSLPFSRDPTSIHRRCRHGSPSRLLLGGLVLVAVVASHALGPAARAQAQGVEPDDASSDGPTAGGVAELQTFAVLPQQSSVSFELGAFLHTVKGSFAAKASEVTLDSEGQRITGEVLLDAQSADTGNKRRDRIMHGEILLSEEHPQIRLVPSSYEGELDSARGGAIELTAHITLVGKTHEVVVPLDVVAGGAPGQLRATGQFEVPFVGWGLKDPSKPLLKVKKEVQIDVDLVLERI